MSSVAEFVEGGVQDPCDDACSICLEAFCAEDPASVTSCNHAYHLQCILEWAQRSSDCPMCWQPLLMKDAIGQELLSSAEHERSLRSSQIQASFLPQLRSEDYELDSFASFEERLMQHLTAASVRQVHGHWRRDRFHFRPTLTERPGQFMYFPTNAAAASAAFGTFDASEAGLEEEQFANVDSQSTLAIGSTRSSPTSVSRTRAPRSGSVAPGASTSEFQSFSEAIKSRFTAASSKYKETFAKTARMFREKIRARNVANSDMGVRSRDVTTGVVQALGQISLEGAQRRDQDEIHAYPTLKQACILDKKQIETHSVPSTNGNDSTVDTGKFKFQGCCRDYSLPTSVGSAGSSEDMLVKVTDIGGESLVKDKQAISIP
ncbi:hypothetical protein O6H91_02G022700 [Diphasiastrum complanatum]|uniref:Uncharacterized protein n=1 Tax=Diphasiastrum complanatum TaxID=34168 RepID=A0ACC2EDL4_DIPCM|nr:hypothetical protein O6H91_02G022700 [Diphasiastrum complanatum]